MSIPLPTLDTLNSIAIATPCQVPWNSMSGDDRSRFCGQCQRPVFDVSAMTTAEALALLTEPGERPCVRLYRRPDGRVLTADCPAGIRVRAWRKLRQRASWAASLFSMFLLSACRTNQGALIFPTPPEAKVQIRTIEEASKAEPEMPVDPKVAD
jgi:hypothetical protein